MTARTSALNLQSVRYKENSPFQDTGKGLLVTPGSGFDLNYGKSIFLLSLPSSFRGLKDLAELVGFGELSGSAF